MPEHPPHIAIAILNYNGKELLRRFLPSVMAIGYPDVSVWVIDNRSTDDTMHWLRKEYPTVGVVQNAGNFGYAKGYNEGLKNIDADYYVLLNSDVAVSPAFLEPVIGEMERRREIAFAQPKIRWERHPDHFEYAGAAGGLLDNLGYPLCRGRIFDRLEKDAGQYDDDAFVFWASGACLVARASVFRSLGGFYEFYFMHQEEIDLCWRAQNNGYKVLASGQSVVWHLGGASLGKDDPQKTFLNFRNNLVMLARNMPLGHLLWMLPVRWLLDGVAAVSFLYKGQGASGLAVIRAWMAFAGWLFGTKKGKYPGKRGFKGLDGVSAKPALWLRYT
ncbi:MAG TPA: glycosyltransferase family 2 protein [Phnomibacter sp.]|nr:glycosyltransferase family 2 protein [Phnomibacter sp.]